MKKLIYALVLSSLVLTTSGTGQTTLQKSGAQNSRELEAKVDAYIKPYLDVKGFSGAILIARGGKVLLSKGYGLANYELNVPNTPQTKFHLASVSKPFTAAAIMILQERGRLNVNDALSKYIPDYPNGDKITLHHLLAHMSGIPNVNNFSEYDRESRFPHTTQQLVEMFKHKPLDFSPGEKYRYSNSNYNVLALIIEKVSGKSYGDFLKENIFEPLGMKETAHDARAEALIVNRANGYVPAGLSDLENVPYLDWTIKTGNGSVYTTVEDMYRWDRALYTEKILKKSSVDQIFTAHAAASVGYGWFIGKQANRRVFRMGGRSPGFTTEIQRYVDDDVCIIVLGNNYAPTASPIANDLAAMVFGEPYKIPSLMKPVKLDEKVLEPLVGRYKFGPDYFVPGAIASIEKRDGQLNMALSTGASVTLLPQSDVRFFDRVFWDEIIFEKDNRGEATELIWR
ncbi:MAG: serine hydrolase, partial [Pyrinomonadaceae bacterium]